MSLTQYLKPDRVNRETVSEDTPLPVAVVSGGGGGGSLSAEATAAAPTYTEGQSAPLSMDLAGGLRVTGSFSASTAGTATAAAPTYTEGQTTAPLSFTLAGDQRVIAKQSGTWNIGSITTLPALAAGSNTIGSISNISGTISLPTGAATAANQTSVIGTKAAGTAAASSILTGGVFNTALPTLTNGQQASLQFDSSARLYVNVGALPSIPAGTNNIGDVDIASIAAGANVIGKVGIDQTTGGTTNGVVLKKANGDIIDPDAPAIVDSGVRYVDVTLTVDTSAYASGDLIADAQIVAACVRSNDATGMLASIMVIDEDDQGAAFTVYFANSSASWGTENSAPAITDANARTILGFVDIATGDYKDLGGVKVAFKANANVAITPVASSDDIYIAVVNGSGTPTYTASGLKLRLGFLI